MDELNYQQDPDRDEHQQNDKYDGHLEQGFFYAALGAENGVSLSENAAQATAAHLQQGRQSEGYGDNYLGYEQKCQHVLTFL